MANEEDAQRVMEQKALTNVRGLVDKLEAGDQAEKTMQRRILIGFVVALAVLGLLWAAGVINLGRGQPSQEIVIPAKTTNK